MAQSKLYVGNLSYGTTEDNLSAKFSSYGKVLSVTIIKDRDTNRSKGFGFITFETEEEANNAVSELDGKEFEGRSIKVNHAKERKSGDSRGQRSYHGSEENSSSGW